MLEAQHAPASLAALALATGLHENTVRGHLEALRRDGFATRSSAPAAGRGRPAWLWQAVLQDASTPYAPLASVLAATVMRTSDDPVADAREAGREWGRELVAARAAHDASPASDDALANDGVGRSEASARETVVDLMREQGFAPEPQRDGETVLLRRCPLLEAAARHPEVVCAVHLGMADGALQALGDDGTAATLQPFTGPSQCTLRMLGAP